MLGPQVCMVRRTSAPPSPGIQAAIAQAQLLGTFKGQQDMSLFWSIMLCSSGSRESKFVLYHSLAVQLWASNFAFPRRNLPRLKVPLEGEPSHPMTYSLQVRPRNFRSNSSRNSFLSLIQSTRVGPWAAAAGSSLTPLGLD